MAKPKPAVAFRSTPPADPALAESFIGGKAPAREPRPTLVDSDAVPPASAPAPPPPSVDTLEGRKVVTRKDGRALRRTTVWMEVELARRVAVYAAHHGVDQTAIIKKALETWLGTNGG